jgi:hypothetical protein
VGRFEALFKQAYAQGKTHAKNKMFCLHNGYARAADGRPVDGRTDGGRGNDTSTNEGGKQ